MACLSRARSAHSRARAPALCRVPAFPSSHGPVLVQSLHGVASAQPCVEAERQTHYHLPRRAHLCVRRRLNTNVMHPTHASRRKARRSRPTCARPRVVPLRIGPASDASDSHSAGHPEGGLDCGRHACWLAVSSRIGYQPTSDWAWHRVKFPYAYLRSTPMTAATTCWPTMKPSDFRISVLDGFTAWPGSPHSALDRGRR
jgi:hypothetical protein